MSLWVWRPSQDRSVSVGEPPQGRGSGGGPMVALACLTSRCQLLSAQDTVSRGPRLMPITVTGKPRALLRDPRHLTFRKPCGQKAPQSWL